MTKIEYTDKMKVFDFYFENCYGYRKSDRRQVLHKNIAVDSLLELLNFNVEFHDVFVILA